MRKILSITIIAGLLLAVPACTEKDSVTNGALEPQGSNDSIQYIITQDYGNTVILDNTIAYQQNTNIMDGLLEAGADVETSYGGGFVSGINGLNTTNGGVTGERYDWFYYVNGIFSDSGALDYEPRPGEIVWWDYHAWKTSQGTPAVIGCFPEPFLHGFRGKVNETVLLPVSEVNDKVKELQNTLYDYGVSDVSVKEISVKQLEERRGPSIAIGEWDKLEKLSWFKEFNEDYPRNGTFLHFTDKGIELLNYKSETVKTIEGEAGVILAAGEGNGDECPLWIISGTDKSGTEAALDVLINNPEKISNSYGVVVLPEEIIKLPLMR